MGLVTLLPVLVLWISISKCIQDDEIALYDKIVGGRKATPHEFPWMASLQRRSPFGYFHTCGAALINPEWLLTAAHCIKSNSTSSYRVMIGSNVLKPDSPENIYSVKTIIVNKDFDPVVFTNDISLIQITPSVRQPVDFLPVPSTPPDVNISAIVIGWGALSEGEAASNELQAAVVGIIPFDECLSIFDSMLRDSMMCAGYLNGGIDACQGDSGGPLLQWRNNQAYLIGIVSWGIGCAERDLPGVYTNLSLFSSWISSYTDPVTSVE